MELKQHTDSGSDGSTCSPKNGAYCNKYGRIYLRISSMDTTQEGWPVRAVDHGISIEEAHCIAVELLNAIQLASQIGTGRANDKGLATQPAPQMPEKHK